MFPWFREKNMFFYPETSLAIQEWSLITTSSHANSLSSNWNCVRDYISCTSSCCCSFSPTVSSSARCTKSAPCQRWATHLPTPSPAMRVIPFLFFSPPIPLVTVRAIWFPHNWSSSTRTGVRQATSLGSTLKDNPESEGLPDAVPKGLTWPTLVPALAFWTSILKTVPGIVVFLLEI